MQVMRSAPDPIQRRKLGESELLVAIDPVSQQLLSYEDASFDGPKPKRMSLDTQLLSERDVLQVRTDLLDCQVLIYALPAITEALSNSIMLARLTHQSVTYNASLGFGSKLLRVSGRGL